jgi:hypothetical protein
VQMLPSRLSLVGLALLAGCTYDASKLIAPDAKGDDGADAASGGAEVGADVGSQRDIGDGSTSKADAPTIDVVMVADVQVDGPSMSPDVPPMSPDERPEVDSAQDRLDLAQGVPDTLPQAMDASLDALDAAARSGVGVACSGSNQCQTGFCVDGVCCETACVSLCTTCNLSGNPGYCLPVPAGQDPKNSCAQDLVSTCGRDGTCDGNGGCRLWPDGTACASPTCTTGTASNARTCNGTGTCRAMTTQKCAPFGCSGSACATKCSASTDCDANAYCNGGTCLGKTGAGGPCTSPQQCSTHYCTQNICAGAVCACPASCPNTCISLDGYTCAC